MDISYLTKIIKTVQKSKTLDTAIYLQNPISVAITTPIKAVQYS